MNIKDLLTIIDDSDHTCLSSYKRIATKLMNDYKLIVNNRFYRIVECEFYYSSENHNDPFVHGHVRQKESIGEWYFHPSGLDITLSNGKAYGGILIRGIAFVDKSFDIPKREDAIIGPLNVCTEIFKHVGSAMYNEPLKFGLLDITTDSMGANMKQATIFSVPRIGLNAVKDTIGGFCNRPYRFISFLHLPHKGIDKIKQYLTQGENPTLELAEYMQYYKREKF